MRRDAREKVKGKDEEVLTHTAAEEQPLAEGEADRPNLEGQRRPSTASLKYRQAGEPDGLGIAIRSSGAWERDPDAHVTHSPTKRRDNQHTLGSDSDDSDKAALHE